MHLPGMAFFVELLATSFAEFLPGFWSRRTQFPHNLPLTLILGASGFLLSLVLLYLTSLGAKVLVMIDFESFRLLKVAYFLACLFIVQVIALLALSKVANQRHEGLMSFVGRQTFCGSQVVGKVFLMIGVIIGMFLVGVFFPLDAATFFDGGATHMLSYMLTPDESLIVTLIVIVILGVAALVAFCWCCGQTIMNCRNEERHPCCVPLGRRLDDEELLGEKMNMNPVAI